MGLDADYNLRRIERYLTTARDGGATPVVVLNKTDVCDDVPECVAEVTAVAQGAPVIAVSMKADDQLRAVEPFLSPGRTIALLGSSGVGKSTLVNRLVGHELQRTRAVRENDQKGRHTTTHRELIILPGGALLIDTPGMRELQLWEDADGIGSAFDDIDSLAAGCRFRDCSHDTEPDCAVKAAVEAGAIDQRRLAELRRTAPRTAHPRRQAGQAGRHRTEASGPDPDQGPQVLLQGPRLKPNAPSGVRPRTARFAPFWA